MKIGIFTDTYFPQINGVAVSTATLKKQLEVMGHEVYVFTSTDPNAPASEHHVYRIPSVAFRTQYRLGVFASPRLVSMITSIGLDVVHTHTEFSLGMLGRIIAHRSHIPIIHTMHTHYEHYLHYIGNFGRFTQTAKSATTKYTALFCNAVDLVIAPSGKTKELLHSYGVRKGIVTIPTGIDLESLKVDPCTSKNVEQLRLDLNISEQDKVIVYVGRISKEKNLDEIIHAMEEYLPNNPDTKLLLVGDGPAKDDIKAMIESSEIEKQVLLAGAQPHDKIQLYYSLGDVFVSASQSETQGITYIEALACGIPIVVKEDPCLQTILVEGKNGFGFTDQIGFLTALEKLLSDKKTRERFSSFAQTHMEKFSVEAFARAIEEAYHNLIISEVSYSRVS